MHKEHPGNGNKITVYWPMKQRHFQSMVEHVIFKRKRVIFCDANDVDAREVQRKEWSKKVITRTLKSRFEVMVESNEKKTFG